MQMASENLINCQRNFCNDIYSSNTDLIMRAGNLKKWEIHTFDTIINPTDVCNFHCSYCCNSKYRTKRILPKHILRQYLVDVGKRNAKENNFQITGGEPFLYPYRHDLIDYITSHIPNKKTVTFLTNGSLLGKNGCLLNASSDDLVVNFIVSLHFEEINISQLLKDFEKIDNVKNITCKILLKPGMLTKIRELLILLDEVGVNIVLDGIFDSNTNPMSYSDEEHKAIRSSCENLPPFIFHEYETQAHSRYRTDITPYDKRFYPDIHDYFGLYCSAGKNTLRLGPDGVVVSCFGLVQAGRYWDLKKTRLVDIPELDQPTICPVKRCHCGMFIKTPKWRKSEDAPDHMRP